jgi:hypothetical protein
MPNASAMTETPPPSEAGAETAWFVQAAGQVWGPYSAVRVARFVAEGRVTPQSLLSTEIEGPFHPAGRWRRLAPLFQPSKLYHHQPAPIADSEPVAQPTPRAAAQPAPATKPEPAPTPDAPQPSPSTAPTRPLLVWADLSGLSPDQFEGLLARYGVVVAIRPAVWLVQARCNAAALRNALSRRLTGHDALMIVHAPLDQAAWFNLDSAAERRLRQVWGGVG